MGKTYDERLSKVFPICHVNQQIRAECLIHLFTTRTVQFEGFRKDVQKFLDYGSITMHTSIRSILLDSVIGNFNGPYAVHNASHVDVEKVLMNPNHAVDLQPLIEWIKSSGSIKKIKIELYISIMRLDDGEPGVPILEVLDFHSIDRVEVEGADQHTRDSERNIHKACEAAIRAAAAGAKGMVSQD